MTLSFFFFILIKKYGEKKRAATPMIFADRYYKTLCYDIIFLFFQFCISLALLVVRKKKGIFYFIKLIKPSSQIYIYILRLFLFLYDTCDIILFFYWVICKITSYQIVFLDDDGEKERNNNWKERKKSTDSNLN